MAARDHSAGGTLASHYTVFLSFRGPDTRADFADNLLSELKAAGIQCLFRDEEEIRGGEHINATLIEGIKRSRISIPIISAGYKDSKACLMELAYMSWLRRTTKIHKVIPIFFCVKPEILDDFPGALENKLGQSSELAEIINNCEETTKEWKEIIEEWKDAFKDLAQNKCKYRRLSKELDPSSSKKEEKRRNRSHGGSTMQVSDSTLTRRRHLMKYMPKMINWCSSTEGSSSTEAASNSNWTEHWSVFMSKVVEDVKEHLKIEELFVPDELVGIEHHIEEMMRKLGLIYHNGTAAEQPQEEIRRVVVTIIGIPGIGKTTLSKVIFNKIQHLFEACCFLENIHESLHPPGPGLGSLQLRLISSLNKRKFQQSNDNAYIHALKTQFKYRRVLIVLDGVLKINDIEGLAEDCNWFGPGSRIILTSNMKLEHVGLIRDAQIHQVDEMDKNLAARLFHNHAFGGNASDEFADLAEKIVDIIKGIPSAIKAVAIALCGEDRDKWVEMLAELDKCPPDPVYESFERAYNSLNKKPHDDKIQQMFLDIACFFVGKDRKVCEYLWRACNFPCSIGIDRLRRMCWVKIEDNNELSMPNQLQIFGKDIVTKEDPVNYWTRSRIWNYEEAKLTLEGKKGNGKVQALALKCDDHGVTLKNEHFERLSDLIFLKLDKADIKGHLKDCLSKLIWLDWQGCPTKTTRLRCLNLVALVILDLSGSEINHQWGGWKRIREEAKKLKVLKLTGCHKLLESPVFSKGMELEILILESCSKLSNIDSIKKLKNLKFLNLKSCRLVGCLPDLSQMPALEELLVDCTCITEFHLPQGSTKKLKILSARECKKLKSLPNSIGELECLAQLILDDAAEIEGLPSSITSLTTLRILSMKGCKGIKSLPGDIGNLKSLEMLDLSGTSIELLPLSVKKLENLRVWKMCGTGLKSFPEKITSLEKLEVLDLRNCQNLEWEIHHGISRMKSLRVLRLSSTKISSLPESVEKLFHLQFLELCKCPSLKDWPIPQSLKGKVIRCEGGHHDHGEFPQFEYSFS